MPGNLISKYLKKIYTFISGTLLQLLVLY